MAYDWSHLQDTSEGLISSGVQLPAIDTTPFASTIPGFIGAYGHPHHESLTTQSLMHNHDSAAPWSAVSSGMDLFGGGTSQPDMPEGSIDARPSRQLLTIDTSQQASTSQPDTTTMTCEMDLHHQHPWDQPRLLSQQHFDNQRFSYQPHQPWNTTYQPLSFPSSAPSPDMSPIAFPMSAAESPMQFDNCTMLPDPSGPLLFQASNSTTSLSLPPLHHPALQQQHHQHPIYPARHMHFPYSPQTAAGNSDYSPSVHSSLLRDEDNISPVTPNSSHSSLPQPLIADNTGVSPRILSSPSSGLASRKHHKKVRKQRHHPTQSTGLKPSGRLTRDMVMSPKPADLSDFDSFLNGSRSPFALLPALDFPSTLNLSIAPSPVLGTPDSATTSPQAAATAVSESRLVRDRHWKECQDAAAEEHDRYALIDQNISDLRHVATEVSKVDNVQLEQPIVFCQNGQRGIRLADALDKTAELDDAEQRLDRFTRGLHTQTLCTELPDLQQMPITSGVSRQGTHSSLTRRDLARRVATKLAHMILARDGHSASSFSKARHVEKLELNVLVRGQMYHVKYSNLVLLSIHHISQGSWQPQLGLLWD